MEGKGIACRRPIRSRWSCATIQLASSSLPEGRPRYQTQIGIFSFVFVWSDLLEYFDSYDLSAVKERVESHITNAQCWKLVLVS